MGKIEEYTKLNRSFTKKLVFNFGSEMGFYSEFNNMVFAILYCLKYQYRFILFSADAKFSYHKGWQDFLNPFPDSTNFYFHKKYNKRIQKPVLSRIDYPFLYVYKLLNPNTYFTYQLWNKFYNAEFLKEQFNIPELNIKGNLREASRQIVDMFYKFNLNTSSDIEILIKDLYLPQKYASLQIRRGDKNTEWEFMPLEVYMKKLTELTDLKKIFVLTDDYSIFDELKNNYPDYSFYTLVDENERGYVHAEFIKLNAFERKRNMIKLFASIEVICQSEIFIGTYTANTGTFIGMKMEESKIFSIQRSSWYQFDDEDIMEFLVK